jgi:hypothetical protein
MQEVNRLLVFIALFQLAVSCSVGNRCGKGYEDVVEGCVKVVKGSAGVGGSAANKDGGSVEDSGDIEDASAVPTGMGASCASSPDCGGKEANYCAYDPVNKVGICTTKDCTANPDNCPSKYRCCDFPESFGMANICLPADKFQAQVVAGICQS